MKQCCVVYRVMWALPSLTEKQFLYRLQLKARTNELGLSKSVTLCKINNKIELNKKQHFWGKPNFKLKYDTLGDKIGRCDPAAKLLDYTLSFRFRHYEKHMMAFARWYKQKSSVLFLARFVAKWSQSFFFPRSPKRNKKQRRLLSIKTYWFIFTK